MNNIPLNIKHHVLTTRELLTNKERAIQKNRQGEQAYVNHQTYKQTERQTTEKLKESLQYKTTTIL